MTAKLSFPEFVATRELYYLIGPVHSGILVPTL